MSDIYKIAVNLAMTSNAPAFIASLVKQLHIAHVHVKELEGGLNRLTRIKLAVGGGLAIAGGAAMLKMLVSLTDQAKELNHQLAGVATMSGDPAKSAQMQAQALATARATAAAVNGTSIAENTKLYAETLSMFGPGEAAKVNAPLAKFGQVLGSITGNFEQANESLYALVRAGDLAGKMVDPKTHQVDTARLMSFLDLAARVAAATHGKVGPQQIFQLAQQGAPALKGMDDDGILTMAMAAQGMGGFRSGTAAMSMFSQFAGGKMTKQVADELKRFGLVGDFDVIKGGGVQFKQGALETDFIKALRKDPAAGAQILQDKLKGAGLSDEQVGTEIFKILGRQTTQRLMSDLLANLPQMLAERSRMKDAQGVDGQYQTREDKDYERNIHDVETAWHNFMAELGLPLTKTAIDILKEMTITLKGWTKAVQGLSPDTIRNIGAGIGILGAALVGGGAVALLAALGPAGWIAAGIIALGAAAVAFKPQLDAAAKILYKWTEDVRIAGDKAGKWLFDLTEKVKNFGVAGVKALVTEIESWPARLGAAISAMGSSLVSSIGGMLKGLFSHLNPFSRTAYDGAGVGGGGFINASYTSDGGANDNAPAIPGGIVNNGTLTINYGDAAAAAVGGGGGGGVIRTSYGGGGRRGYGGGGGDEPSSSGPVPTAPLTNERLAAQRAAFFAEMDRNPRLLRDVIKTASMENNGSVLSMQAALESMVNRSSMNGYHSLNQAIHSGFYGPVNHGELAGSLSAKDRADGMKALAAIRAGGNIIGYRTDQGMWSDPGARRYRAQGGDMSGWAKIHGENFFYMGPQGREWAKRQADADRAFRPPPRRAQTEHHHFRIELDGKQVEARVTAHQSARGMFPTAVGGIDSHGSFASPGTPLIDAA